MIVPDETRGVIRTPADIDEIENMPLSEFIGANSIYDLIRQAAQTFGDKAAFVYLPDGEPGTQSLTTSYKELLFRVTQAANLFRGTGTGFDDCIAILSPNIPEGQIALWAAETACRACPINFMLDTGHIIEIMKQARVKALVSVGDSDDLQLMQKIREIVSASDLSNVFIIGNHDADSGFQDFAQSLERYPGDRLIFERDINHRTIAALFHTGGTTGVPKLAQHQHGNQLFTSRCAALFYDLKSDDVLINGFPIFHVAGTFIYSVPCFATGATQVLTTRTGYRNSALMRNIWKHVEQNKVTVFGCVPTVLAGLAQTDINGADLSRLRVFYTGGSPLSTELAEAVENRFSVPVRNIYGMTECAGLLSLQPFHAVRVSGSAGYRLPYTELCAFAQSADGSADISRPCKPGETGILAFRGPNVSPGYTDSSRDRGTFEDGWLITGDLGFLDEKGYMFVTGREKDVIIRGAHNIDPAAIENALSGHPAIVLATAVGQPDPYAGEIPVVYAELGKDARVTEAELIEFVKPLIPEPAACPKRIEFVSQLPKTAVGKIFKPEVRRFAAEYAFRQSLAVTDFSGRIEGVFENGQIKLNILIEDSCTEEQMDSYKKVLRNYTLKYDFIRNSQG